MTPLSAASRLLLALGMIPAFSLTAQGQVTPDATLGSEGSVVTPGATVQGAPADLIEGGATRGGNLFHSFSQFNVEAGQRLYFANPAGIDSILSRVTGGDLSNIFGTLGVDGGADLFLINPNGIVFGENAALDVAGSFYASTAEAIPLGAGVYSATAPEQSTLLRVDPSALLSSYLSDASGDIENRGALAAEENLTLAANNLDLQGQVAAGGDLTLLGLESVQIRDTAAVPFVGFAGGDLLVQGNERVDIVALSHPGSGLYSYGDMVLRSANPVGGDAHYWSGGSFQVEGLDGEAGNLFSPIDPIIRTFGDVTIGSYFGSSLHVLAGGAVRIDAAIITRPDAGTVGVDFFQETITLSDGTVVEVNGSSQPTLDVRAGVLSDVISTPPLAVLTGFNPATDFFANSDVTELPSSSDITIGDVVIADDGLVLLTNQYESNLQLIPGNIRVESQIAPIAGAGGIFAGNVLLGRPGSGTISLDARNDIIVIDSLITTISPNDSGGDILLLAGGTLSFDSPNGNFTGAVTGTPLNVVTRGGDIRVRATNLEMTNGTQLNAATIGPGAAGSVIVDVREMASFDGVSPFLESGRPTGIRSSANAGSGGRGGDIRLSAANLIVINGATLTASTFGTGDAGNIALNITETARFDGVNPLTGLGSSGAFSSVEIGGEGKGGNVQLSAANLEVTNGAQLSASTFGIGNAGNVILTIVDTANFDGVDPSGTRAGSGAFSNVSPNGVGLGGNVELSATNLEVTSGAQIAAGTFGIGDSGNVILTITGTARFDGVNPVTGLTPSGAFSSVEIGGEGHGGNIQLFTTNLEVSNGAQLSASTSGIGDAGDVILSITDTAHFDGVDPSGIRSLSGARSSVEQGGEGQGGNVVLSATNLEVANGAQLIASTFGRGDSGDVILMVSDTAGFDGVNPLTGLNPSGALSNIESGGVGAGGNVELNAANLEVTNGANLGASTFGMGDAGKVILTITNTARFDGVNLLTNLNNPSGVFSTIQPGGEGNGGDVQLSATNLGVTNGAQLIASTLSGAENSWQSQHENVTTLANSMRQSKASRLD